MPFMLIILALYHYTIVERLLPEHVTTLKINLNMFLLILILPIKGAMITLVYYKAISKQTSYKQVIYLGFARLLSLLGCLLSMILLPLIVLGLGMVIYLIMGFYNAPFWSLFLFLKIIPLLVFAVILPKIFAPFLVYTHNQGASESIEVSTTLVKGFYRRTFIFTLFAILLIEFLYKLVYLPYWPGIEGLSDAIKQGIAYALILLIGPWSLACMIMQLADLQFRKKGHLNV